MRGTNAETPAVRTASPADEARVTKVITLAFSADPMARFVFADPEVYLTHMSGIIRAFGGRAFAHGSAYVVDGYVGAALWLLPGAAPDEETMVSLLQATVPEKRQADVFGVREQMGRYHPSEPHWYLPLIGVDPMHQGRGYGSLLMQHALRVCDDDGALAYLESSSPRNVPLYERHGFQVVGTIQAGNSPQIYAMLRKPR
jgi:GNAT superfamily N-acetyltransferase